MLYSFKLGSKRIAFDNEKMKLYSLSELEWNISVFVGEDMPQACPSALRYALAKFDSQTINAAYKSVYDMRYGTAEGKPISFSTLAPEVSIKDEPDLYNKVISLANDGHTSISAEYTSDCDEARICAEYEKIAREIYKRTCQKRPFVFTPFLITEREIRDYASLSSLEKKCVECALFTQL